MASENGVTITDNGLWKTMKANNIVEECSCDRCSSVRVSKGNEMGKLRESVYHCENDTFAIDFQKAFDEVKRDIGPNLVRNFQWL